MSSININGRMVGDGHPAYIIAEMSANHAGSMERALELIHVAKESGADCVKIQTYTPDTMTIDCGNEYFHIGKGTWEGENLYSLYRKAYTPWEWQAQLRDEAARVGIDFLSTAFDRTSVDFLEELGVRFYKIASFELVDIPLLEYIASRNKPVILSTGMGTIEEITEAVNAIYSTGNRQLALMKCSSAYPAKSEEMNLATIRDLRARFDIPVGLSDHSMGAFSAATAVAMGACIVEKHFCVSRAIENPDSVFSMEPDEFADMVRQVREVEKAMGTVSYGVTAQEESNSCFRRSLFVVQDIAAGEKLTPDNIRSIRPAYGLKPKYYRDVLGRTAKCDLRRGTPLTPEVIDGFGESGS
ncbi:MAG: pseudaminic acid synthase [Lachnospiraceae bacterium]|nr:pseudaminic acid synthase [Lachnospiraceae bacterium]